MRNRHVTPFRILETYKMTPKSPRIFSFFWFSLAHDWSAWYTNRILNELEVCFQPTMWFWTHSEYLESIRFFLYSHGEFICREINLALRALKHIWKMKNVVARPIFQIFYLLRAWGIFSRIFLWFISKIFSWINLMIFTNCYAVLVCITEYRIFSLLLLNSFSLEPSQFLSLFLILLPFDF